MGKARLWTSPRRTRKFLYLTVGLLAPFSPFLASSGSVLVFLSIHVQETETPSVKRNDFSPEGRAGLHRQHAREIREIRRHCVPPFVLVTRELSDSAVGGHCGARPPSPVVCQDARFAA